MHPSGPVYREEVCPACQLHLRRPGEPDLHGRAGSGKRETRETTLTYDQNKHPYYDLGYYFHGETYVNNMLTRTDGDFKYTYETLLNEYTYPETVYEKLGSACSRIIYYSYEIL